MQYLKESVRENIIKSALNEFSQNGYKGASMRRIAANADVVSGNIYRYFQNKEDLFDSAVGHVYAEIKKLISEVQEEILDKKAEYTENYSIDILKKISDRASMISSEYGTEFYILLNKSEGTKYSVCKEEVKKIVFGTLQKLYTIEIQKRGRKLEDSFMLFVLASSFVDGLSLILTCGKGHDQIKSLTDSWMRVSFFDIDYRL